MSGYIIYGSVHQKNLWVQMLFFIFSRGNNASWPSFGLVSYSSFGMYADRFVPTICVVLDRA